MGFRFRPEEHDHGTERWLISYADFITLLFAFFVILYATSERDAEKAKKFQQSVDKFLVKAGAFGETGAQVAQGEKNFAVIEPPIKTFRPEKPEDLKVFNSLQEAIESQFTEAESKKYLIDLAPEDRGVRVILAARSLFSGNSAKFTDDSVKFVDHLGKILKGQNKRLLIEGHVAPDQHGQFASSWDLASARANNLLRYYQIRYAWKANALASASYGSSRPLDHAKQTGDNDRLELLLFYNDSDF